MSWKTALCALSLLGGMPSCGWAADATPAQAEAVRGDLARYLGHDAVAVAPAGSAYRIDIDLQKLFAVLAPSDVRLDPVTLTMRATPQDDGQWHVVSDGPPLVTLHMRDQVTSVAVNNQHFDGLFDPRLPAFTSATNSYDSLSVGATGADAPTQVRQLDKGLQTAAATPRGDGVVALKATQTNTDYAQDITFDGPQGGHQVSIKSGPTVEGLTVDNLHVRALADLWAFLVAHPDRDSLKRDATSLKTLLRQALPAFDRWSQDASLQSVSVTTPFGPVLARNVAGHLDLTGLVATGSASVALRADGLAIPTGPLPAWAPAVLPTAIDLHDGIAGYRLDQAATTAIDNLDLDAPQLLPQTAIDTIKATVAPRDQLVVNIGDSRITTPTIEARFAGEIHFAGPVPSFKITAHATGFDKAIAAIQGKADADASASQAIALLMLVKGYGQAGPDGTLTWTIIADGTGETTVNGVPLPIGQPR